MIRKLPHPLSFVHKKEFELLNEQELAALCDKKFFEGVIVVSHDEFSFKGVNKATSTITLVALTGNQLHHCF